MLDRGGPRMRCATAQIDVRRAIALCNEQLWSNGRPTPSPPQDEPDDRIVPGSPLVPGSHIDGTTE